MAHRVDVMRVLSAIPVLALGALCGPVWCYETPTHAEMSAAAVRLSTADQVLTHTGVGGSLTAPAYDGRTLLDWIRLGSMAEDNLPRFINHFYNPLTGRGLPGAVPSPVWALGDPRPRPGQQFSLWDAGEYYYRSLTLPAKTDRDAQLAVTFRSLGQVIHLIQDAAQPQHTRDDTHFPYSPYERLTDRLRDTLPYHGYASVVLGEAREYWNTMPPPVRPPTDVLQGRGMAEYSHRGFVTSGTNYRVVPGSNPVDAVTAPGFPLPAFDRQAVTTLDVTELEALFPNCAPGAPLRGRVRFHGNEVTDAYDPGASAFNPFATVLGLYASDLEQLPFVPRPSAVPAFTHNRFSYCAAHDFLIPRAVGYSAGLIDYFFRGRLDVFAEQADGVLTVGIVNASGADRTLSRGSFELYYDASDGTRKSLRLTSGARVGREGIEWQAGAVVTAPIPADLDASKPKPYLLLFKGTVGREDGVAAVALAPEPTDTSPRQVQAWYGRAIYTIGDSASDPVEGNIFGSGITWFDEEGRRYSMGVGAYYGGSEILPPGTPADLNYWRDISYFYMLAEIVQHDTGEILFREIRPYANSGALTLTGGLYSITLTYTAERDDVARVCLVNETVLEFCQ